MMVGRHTVTGGWRARRRARQAFRVQQDAAHRVLRDIAAREARWEATRRRLAHAQHDPDLAGPRPLIPLTARR